MLPRRRNRKPRAGRARRAAPPARTPARRSRAARGGEVRSRDEGVERAGLDPDRPCRLRSREERRLPIRDWQQRGAVRACAHVHGGGARPRPDRGLVKRRLGVPRKDPAVAGRRPTSGVRGAKPLGRFPLGVGVPPHRPSVPACGLDKPSGAFPRPGRAAVSAPKEPRRSTHLFPVRPAGLACRARPMAGGREAAREPLPALAP